MATDAEMLSFPGLAERLPLPPEPVNVLRDEGDWMGRKVTCQLDHLLAQAVGVALAALVAPPPGDLQEALDALLLAVLAPTAAQ